MALLDMNLCGLLPQMWVESSTQDGLPQAEEAPMRWSEFVATLGEREHWRLILVIMTGLHEARTVAEGVTNDGDIDELCQHLDTAIGRLEEARRVLRKR